MIGYHLVYLRRSALLCSVLVQLGQTVVWSWGPRLKDSTQGGVGQVICRGVPRPWARASFSQLAMRYAQKTETTVFVIVRTVASSRGK